MSRPGFISIAAGSTGRWFLTKVDRAINQLAFLAVCLKLIVTHRSTGRGIRWRVIIQQIYFTGVQSLELVAFIALLFGVLAVVRGFTFMSSLGSQEALGSLIIAILFREVGPLMTAIIVVLRSGSAIALEIGYMNVLGEIEGLEMQGVPAVHFLCIPRLVGVTAAVVCLIILFDLISIAGGIFAAWVIIEINVWNLVYDLAAAFSISDFVGVLVKGLSFGVIISIVCMYHGFLAQGAITNIPPRVSRAMVECLLYCVFFDIIISVAFYV